MARSGKKYILIWIWINSCTDRHRCSQATLLKRRKNMTSLYILQPNNENNDFEQPLTNTNTSQLITVQIKGFTCCQVVMTVTVSVELDNCNDDSESVVFSNANRLPCQSQGAQRGGRSVMSTGHRAFRYKTKSQRLRFVRWHRQCESGQSFSCHSTVAGQVPLLEMVQNDAESKNRVWNKMCISTWPDYLFCDQCIQSINLLDF